MSDREHLEEHIDMLLRDGEKAMERFFQEHGMHEVCPCYRLLLLRRFSTEEIKTVIKFCQAMWMNEDSYRKRLLEEPMFLMRQDPFNVEAAKINFLLMASVVAHAKKELEIRETEFEGVH